MAIRSGDRARFNRRKKKFAQTRARIRQFIAAELAAKSVDGAAPVAAKKA
jgi:hypothetical protein